MSKRYFTWDTWDFDCNGTAYIIALDECPNIEDVPKYVVEADGLSEEVLNSEHDDFLSVADVKEGWCKFMVRSDWDNFDGPCGAYYAEICPHMTTSHKGGGWFRVWIVRRGLWY